MEKNTPYAERDADAAVSGRVPADPELVVVQRALSHMKEALIMEPSIDVISRHAAAFAAAVPTAGPAPRVGSPSPWRRRVAAAVAVAVVSAFGAAGAAAANDAAPGDRLYSLDRDLESIGILDGGVGERFEEADVLAQKGDVDGAVALTVEALDGDGQHEAALALEQAAVAVKTQSSGDDVRLQVSEMLQWMSQQHRGDDFGAKVSERAREIAANQNQNQNQVQNQIQNQDQNSNADENAYTNQNQNQTGDADGTGDGICTSDPTCTDTGNVNGAGSSAGAGASARVGEPGKSPAVRTP